MDACASGDDLGQQVGKAAQRLVKAGFEKTYMLNGGNIGWHAAQLPVAKGSK
jgi:rhodanese-related sulfurtransferase